MNSFWEQDAMQDADCIVVGAGMIGLLTALELRDRHPEARIMVLERGLLPSGASSRNGGFACFGSLTEILADIDAVGVEATVALIARRWHGLARLRERIGDVAMAFENLGGHELLDASQLPALARIDEINAALMPLFGAPVFVHDGAGLAASGFGATVCALILNRFESQLHSGKLMRALAVKAGAARIEIHTGAQVSAIEDSATEVMLEVAASATSSSMRLRAGSVALCTNGMTGVLAPQAGITPARGQVLVTEPVPGLPWRGCHYFDQGYYYFRNVDDRVLLGGGRNLDFEGEGTMQLALTAPIQEALERMLAEVILPGRAVHIASRWAGLMGFSADKQPVVKLLSPHVAIGFGCNGMGVALAADTAARTAGLLA